MNEWRLRTRLSGKIDRCEKQKDKKTQQQLTSQPLFGQTINISPWKPASFFFREKHTDKYKADYVYGFY